MTNAAEILYPSMTPTAEAGAAAVESTPNVPAKAAAAGEQPVAAGADPPAAVSLAAKVSEVVGGVRWGEPAPVGPRGYVSIFPGPVPADAVIEREQALAACVKLGIGVTQLGAAVALAQETMAKGYQAPTDPQTFEVLHGAWGEDMVANVGIARAYARKVIAAWPGFFHLLEQNRLGSHPGMIRLLYEKAVHGGLVEGDA